MLAMEKRSTVMKKFTRTISGVTPVAVMTMPMPCPGRCVYCPTYSATPQSYTPESPAVLRGKECEYDALNRKIKEKNIGSCTNLFKYDELGRITEVRKKDYEHFDRSTKDIVKSDIVNVRVFNKDNSINALIDVEGNKELPLSCIQSRIVATGFLPDNAVAIVASLRESVQQPENIDENTALNLILSSRNLIHHVNLAVNKSALG